jgi:hypothetical protein
MAATISLLWGRTSQDERTILQIPERIVEQHRDAR